MVGTATNGSSVQEFSISNGVQDVEPNGAAMSVAGSEYYAMEFTKDSVDMLLNERSKIKSKFNYKVCGFCVIYCILYLSCSTFTFGFTFMDVQERCENMSDYIKRLRQCIRWFQQIESNYDLEHENLRNMLESSELRRNEIGLFYPSLFFSLSMLPCMQVLIDIWF